jgi:hypothetical protein
MGRAASSASLGTMLGDLRCPAFSLSARETTSRAIGSARVSDRASVRRDASRKGEGNVADS